VSMRGERPTPQRSMQGMMDADVIVMQRPYEQSRKEIFNLLKEAGKKVVFDNDDTYKGHDRMKLGPTLDIIDNNIDWFIERSDMVTTTTEYLADEYRKLNKNVAVLPNCIDPDAWGKPLQNRTKKYRVGLIGSVVGTEDVAHVLSDIKKISDDPRFQLVVFGLPDKKAPDAKLYEEEYAYWLGMNVEWHPFVNIWDYAETLRQLKLDVMMIPREDSYFNRCKSNLKFLEASMLEVPVLGQGFKDGRSPYQQDPFQNIVIEGSWYERLVDMYENRDKWKEEARKAHKYVLENYSIEKNINRWKEVYSSLL
jgi:glycosyltransferase involved in cell wall biosynthesis